MGLGNGAATVESSTESLSKFNEVILLCTLKQGLTWMFVPLSPLFSITKARSKVRLHQLMNEWGRVLSIYNWGQRSLEREQVLTRATTWVTPEDNNLSFLSQSRKDSYRALPLFWQRSTVKQTELWWLPSHGGGETGKILCSAPGSPVLQGVMYPGSGGWWALHVMNVFNTLNCMLKNH